MLNEFDVHLTDEQKKSIETLLCDTEFGQEITSVNALTGDGSDRTFLRLMFGEESLLAILPDSASTHGFKEAESSWNIGHHLMECGVPVPELHSRDPETGIILCEDLGDFLLYNAVIGDCWSDEKILDVYGKAVEILVHMQVEGGRDFQTIWCWDTGKYNRELMLSSESGYFLSACCHELLGISTPEGLDNEFILLADLASSAQVGFFLHRDFQSRNIMIKNECLRVIDYQGGRMGPLGYDLASLLNDPYVSLGDHIKEKLIVKYLQTLSDFMDVDGTTFMESYYWLSLQRNLQIIGAFSYLSNIKGKKFFRGFLQPAAMSLNNLLAEPLGGRFPVLRSLAESLPEEVAQVLK